MFLLRLIDELLCGHAVPCLAAVCNPLVSVAVWALTAQGHPPLPHVPTGAWLELSSSCLVNMGRGSGCRFNASRSKGQIVKLKPRCQTWVSNQEFLCLPGRLCQVWCTGESWFSITGSIPFYGISLDLAPSLPCLRTRPTGFSWSSSACPSTRAQTDGCKPSCVSHKSHGGPEMVQ